MLHDPFRMGRLVGIGLVVLFIAGSQDPVGTVIDVQGRWTLEGSPPITLERGTPLPSGGRIRPPQPPQPGDRLQAVFVFDGDNTRVMRVMCDVGGECARPVELPSLPGSYRLTAQFTRIREAISLFISDNSLFALRRARADGQLREAVVRVEAGVVDLTPALGELPNQRYIAGFTAVTRSATPSNPVESLPFSLNRRETVRVEGLRPGVYRLELIVAGESTRAGPEVWVLVTDRARYADATNAFDLAVRSTESWKDGADAGTRQAFLRAFLLNLMADPTIGR
jgi:hypothetical protein